MKKYYIITLVDDPECLNQIECLLDNKGLINFAKHRNMIAYEDTGDYLITAIKTKEQAIKVLELDGYIVTEELLNVF